MIKLQYQFKDSFLREKVNLLNHKQGLENAIKNYPMVQLEAVEKDSYSITINTDDSKKKDNVVRSLGHAIAKDESLKKFVEHKEKKNELFIEKKVEKEKSESEKTVQKDTNTTTQQVSNEKTKTVTPAVIDKSDRNSPYYDPFYDPSR